MTFNYFAPPPLATQLLARDVDVREYPTPLTAFNEPPVVRRIMFTGVNLDGWACGALGAIESVFTPHLPERAASLAAGLYDDLRTARQDLANAISGATALAGGRVDLARHRLASVYVSQETEDFEAAVETFRQALLVNLEAFSDTPAFARGRAPAPFRSCPSPPVLRSETATPTHQTRYSGTAAEQIRAAMQWTYAMCLARPAAAQDDLLVMLTINEAEEESSVLAPRPSGTTGAPSDLFLALARFQAEFPCIAAILDCDATPARLALQAYRRVQVLMMDLATAWVTWQNLAPVTEPLAGGWYRMCSSQTGVTVTAEIEGAPWPLVNGRAGVVSEGVAEYSQIGAGELSIAWPGLNVLTQHSVRGSALVERNANLGADVAATFVYRSPATSSRNPVVPMLNPDWAITIAEQTALQAMRTVFDAVTTTGAIGMATSWSAAVDQIGQFRIEIPVSLLPPTDATGIADIWATDLTTWCIAHKPALLDAEVHVTLTVFSSSEVGALPLVKIFLILPVSGADWFAASPVGC